MDLALFQKNNVQMLLQTKIVINNSHTNVVMDHVLNLIFYAQLNNHVQQDILDVGIMNVFHNYHYVKN